MSDLIDRDALKKAIGKVYGCDWDYVEKYFHIAEAVNSLPSAEIDNEVYLCDFCKYDYPECPTKCSDVIFGNGMGHNNVCACAKFEIKPERTAKVKSKNYYGTTTNTVGYFTCVGKCGNCDCEVNEHYVYCPICGARLEWK